MQVAEIQVVYVNPPKGRARSGSIKDTDGAYWGIEWPAMQHSFKEGGTYKVKYEQNGQYRNIKDMKLVSEGSPAAAARGHGGGDPDLAERIFVCGALNATLSNPTVNAGGLSAETVAEIVDCYRQAWAMTFGAKKEAPPQTAKAAPRDDMKGDEIPW